MLLWHFIKSLKWAKHWDFFKLVVKYLLFNCLKNEKKKKNLVFFTLVFCCTLYCNMFVFNSSSYIPHFYNTTCGFCHLSSTAQLSQNTNTVECVPWLRHSHNWNHLESMETTLKSTCLRQLLFSFLSIIIKNKDEYIPWVIRNDYLWLINSSKYQLGRLIQMFLKKQSKCFFFYLFNFILWCKIVC